MVDIYKQSIMSKTDMIAQLAEALKDERTKRSRLEQQLSQLEAVAQHKHAELMQKRAAFLNETEESRAVVSSLRREITALQKLVESIENVAPEDEEYYLSLLRDQHTYNLQAADRLSSSPARARPVAAPLIAGTAEDRLSQRIKRIESSLQEEKNAHSALLSLHDDLPSQQPGMRLGGEHVRKGSVAHKIAKLVFAKRASSSKPA